MTFRTFKSTVLASIAVLAITLQAAAAPTRPQFRVTAYEITADLAGFWRGAWADARKDMRGRYPKHHWPEDPTIASARKG